MKKYPDSIITDNLENCFICGAPYAEVHHLMNGTNGHRVKSTKYGLVCGLCKKHHTAGREAIHNNAKFREDMKALAQHKFEEIYGRELWMKEFRKNYL